MPEHPSASLVRLSSSGKLLSRTPLGYERPVTTHGGRLVTQDMTTGADVLITRVDPSPAARSPFHDPPGGGTYTGSGHHILTVDGIALVQFGDIISGVHLGPTSLRWRSSDHGYRADAAVGYGRRAYAVGLLTTEAYRTSGRVYAIDPARGDIKWARPTLMHGYQGSGRLLVLGDVLVVAETDPAVGGSGAVQAFDIANGRLRWTSRLPEGTVTSFSRHGAELIVTTQGTAYYSD